MALDPRLECLPEHQGPAFRTWQLIMQTTMGKVVQTPSPAAFQFQQSLKQAKTQIDAAKVPFKSGEDFISLDSVSTNKNSDKAEGDNTSLKRKKSASSTESLSSLEDEHTFKSEGVSPWKTYEKYPDNVYGLHLEIQDFYNYISPLPQEECMRNDVVQRITNLITTIWPAAKVEVFGSFRTNLYLPTSDIDLAVFGKWESLPLYTLEKALISKDLAEAATIKVLDKATVPIIKLTDKKSKIRVDISFNTETSVKSAEMVKAYIKEFKILPYLFLTLKHFLFQRDLNEVFTGGISSYCLMLLTVSFLQLHPRVDVRKEKDVNLGVLLMEFFELYGRNFNYQKIGVKIKNGGCYVSKDEVAKELTNGEYPALLCIEDPVTLACDIGRSSYGILRVKEAFEYAFNVVDKALRNKSYFTINPHSTYLSRIICIPPELCSYRNWVGKLYANHIFVPTPIKTTPVTTVYHEVGGYNGSSNNNVRPALLPTPHSPYSPRLNMMKSPSYGPMTFFSNNQPIVITSNAPANSNSISNPPIHMQNFTMNNLVNSQGITTSSNVSMPNVGGYAYRSAYQDQQKASSHMYSPVSPSFSTQPFNTSNKTMSIYNNKGSTYITSSASITSRDIIGKTFTNSSYLQSRNNRNNGIFFKQKDDRRNNSRNSSRNTSPRDSPKLQYKEFAPTPLDTTSKNELNSSHFDDLNKNNQPRNPVEKDFHSSESAADIDYKSSTSPQSIITTSASKETIPSVKAATVPLESLSDASSCDCVIIESSNLQKLDPSIVNSKSKVSDKIVIELSDDDLSVEHGVVSAGTVNTVIALSSDSDDNSPSKHL